MARDPIAAGPPLGRPWRRASSCSLVLATDRLLDPADLSIAVLFLVALLLAASVAVRSFWPLRTRPSDRQVARFIEERCPGLEDRLASATEVAERPAWSGLAGLVVHDAVRTHP